MRLSDYYGLFSLIFQNILSFRFSFLQNYEDILLKNQ